MSGILLRLRWSWRDLRARWLQVVAIALVIGIGSGVYSGLSSTSEWRQVTYDTNYEQLAMWDLHVELAEGTSVPSGTLTEAVAGIADPEAVDAAEARLVLPTQVDASVGGQDVVVPGQVVGVETDGGGPNIARIHPVEGRTLAADDAGSPVAVLDEHFAAHYGLPAEGRITVGGEELRYVGRGLSPEYFVIIPPRGLIFGEAGFAVLWAPLETVQEMTGREGEANSLVLTVADGADRDQVEEQVATALDEALGDVGFTIARQEDDPGLRTLYDDIDGDQRLNTVMAFIVLLGAAFAAFNLTGRIVDAQRREIGIGLALGVRPLAIASRPLLVGVQVALLGVVFGVAIGFAIQTAMVAALDSVLPMPEWTTDFQPGVFAQGAALGLVLPLVATILPVVGAVRVAPVDAIRTTHRMATGGLAPLLRRLPLPGSSLVKLPFRNVARAPKRTVMTALGLGAAIAALVAVIGLIDSYRATIDRGDEEILADVPDRLLLDLDPAVVESAPVQEVLDSPLLAQAEAGLALGGTLDPADAAIDVFLSVTDLDSTLWRPTVERSGWEGDEPGVVLARKAVEDLGLSPGDTVTLRHPVLAGEGVRLVESDMPVRGVHPNPLRFIAYVDITDAGLFDLEGITNSIQAVPAPGVAVADVQRDLMEQPGVVSVQPVRAQLDAISDRIDEFMAFFTVIQVAILVLALLIAFGTSSINVDERRRENATMFAYGVRPRAVLGVNVVEGLLVGVAGTAIGLAAGRLLVSWITLDLMADTLPEIKVVPTVAPGTALTALLIGVVASAAAPLLTIRRLRRMDIPSTLRVME